MSDHVIEKLIQIVREDSSEALGCTEPVAVAYAGNVAGQYIDKKNISEIELETSKNIYKNGKSVKIPNTGSYGLDLAAAAGVLSQEAETPFLVFSMVTEQVMEQAEKLLKKGAVKVSYAEEGPDLYIRLRVRSGEEQAEVVISHAHTHVESIRVNGEEIFKDEYREKKIDDDFDIKSLSFAELKKYIDEAPDEMLAFTLRGVEVNRAAAEQGIKGFGSNLGRTLCELKQKGILPDSFVTDTRIMTAAAADMRMGGGECAIMTSGGSGNQGIGVILPIAMVAEHEHASGEKLAKALFFGHCINRYVKEYSGKLSGICGCAIGAGVGASAGVAYILGGTDRQIAGACTNIYANLTGVVCDGAKESCSMKLATSAEEAVIAAYLAVSGVISDANVGVIGGSIEETISNIGRLSRGAFKGVDDLMLQIIDR